MVSGISLDDAPGASPKRTVSIAVNLPADFRGSALPVSFRLFNAAGEEQYNETLTVPVFGSTASEADAVLKQVLADPTASEQNKTLARGVLTPTNKGSDLGDGGGTGDRNKPGSGQNPGSAVSEGSSTAGIIVAVPANANFGARR